MLKWLEQSGVSSFTEYFVRIYALTFLGWTCADGLMGKPILWPGILLPPFIITLCWVVIGYWRALKKS